MDANGSILIVGMIIAALAPTLAALAAYIKAKSAADDTKAIKESAAQTAASVEAAHKAINSERTATIDELKKMREEILVLSKQKATLEEHQRSSQAGERLITVAPVEPTRMTDTQLFKLVKELGNELDLRRLGKAKE